jgi:hypothetical protein
MLDLKEVPKITQSNLQPWDDQLGSKPQNKGHLSSAYVFSMEVNELHTLRKL